MKFLISISFFSVLFLSSCVKNTSIPESNFSGEYALSGYILDEVTSAPIPGAEVFILEKEGGILVQTPEKQIAFTKSDANGRYEIKFPVQASGYLYMFQARAEHKFYFKKPHPEKIEIAKSGESNFDWRLDPPGWVNISAIKTSKANYINFQGSYISGSFSNSNIDSTYMFLINAADDIEISVFKYHSDPDSNSISTLNFGKIEPFDTIPITITF